VCVCVCVGKQEKIWIDVDARDPTRDNQPIIKKEAAAAAGDTARQKKSVRETEQNGKKSKEFTLNSLEAQATISRVTRHHYRSTHRPGNTE